MGFITHDKSAFLLANVKATASELQLPTFTHINACISGYIVFYIYKTTVLTKTKTLRCPESGLEWHYDRPCPENNISAIMLQTGSS